MRIPILFAGLLLFAVAASQSQDLGAQHPPGRARAPSPCSPEIFVLGERPLRLADARFRGDVYVYVDEIRNDWRKHPPTLTVLNGLVSTWRYDQNGQGPLALAEEFASRTKGAPASTRWSLTVRHEGDAVQFRYGTDAYLLTVKSVSLDAPIALLGLRVERANQLTVQICEALPASQIVQTPR
jgi:hypothetical protein